jgi:predicted alpha/beta superfamily hydrolase
MFKWIVGGLFAAFLIAMLSMQLHFRSKEASDEQAGKDFEQWVKQQKFTRVKFVVTAPPETPKDQTLFISGSMPPNSWDGAGVPLQRKDDGTYVGEAEVMTGLTQQFKVTRGSWNTVEIKKDDSDVDNREFTPTGENDVVKADVAAWRDKGQLRPGRITLTGDIRVHRKVRSELLNNERNVTVYLPPGYDAEGNEARYPVLYVNDGNNLFDESGSYAGIEWRLDEAAQKHIGDGKIEPVIIVGIWNTEQRGSEYTPKELSSERVGRADEYARFIVEGIKPLVDSQYRTKTDAKDTGIGGGSLGGLAAIATAKQYPDVFGKLVLFSPHLVDRNTKIDSLIGDAAALRGDRIWMYMGGNGTGMYPGERPLEDAQALVAKLKSAGADVMYVELPDGTHNEPAWQLQVPAALSWLYGK